MFLKSSRTLKFRTLESTEDSKVHKATLGQETAGAVGQQLLRHFCDSEGSGTKMRIRLGPSGGPPRRNGGLKGGGRMADGRRDLGH